MRPVAANEKLLLEGMQGYRREVEEEDEDREKREKEERMRKRSGLA